MPLALGWRWRWDSRWHDLGVPFEVADEQHAYERRQRVLRAYETGIQQREIAKILDISASRVWQLCQKAKLDECAPVERYFNEKDDVRRMAGRIIRHELIWRREEMAAKNQVAAVERMAPDLPVLPENPTTMQIIAMASRDDKVDVTKMRELITMKREEEAIEAKVAFEKALTRTQRDIEPVLKDAKSDKGKYASYSALSQMVKPLSVQNGFNISFDTDDGAPPDMVRVVAYVTHNKGHSRRYKIDMPADGKGPKGGDVMTRTHATGSAITYGKRYLLCMIFDIVTVDDDGKAAGAVQKHGEPLTEAQLDQMMHRMAQVGMTAPYLIERLKETANVDIEAIKDCPARLFDRIMKSLETYGKRAAQKSA